MLEEQYGQFETAQRQHLLQEYLGVEDAEKLRDVLTNDMITFNQALKDSQSDITTNMSDFYSGYNSLFSGFIEDYKANLEDLQALQEQLVSILGADYSGSLTSSLAQLLAQLQGQKTTTTKLDTTGLKVINEDTYVDDNYDEYTSVDYGEIWWDTYHDALEDGVVTAAEQAALEDIHDQKVEEMEDLFGEGVEEDHYDPSSGKWYANGIENGPVTYTGLAMLHGSPSSPEYVLNNDQAYSLLRYMSTTKPEFSSNFSGSGDTVYDFGGIVMNEVNNAEEFFSELNRAMSNRFNVTKHKI